MKILLTFLLWLPSAVYAWSDWTQEQRLWYMASNLALTADWATTRDLSRRYHQGYYETNVLLGRQPSTDRVDLYFATVLIGNYFLADALTSQNRTLYLQIVTGVETAVTLNNLRIGLRIQF